MSIRLTKATSRVIVGPWRGAPQRRGAAEIYSRRAISTQNGFGYLIQITCYQHKRRYHYHAGLYINHVSRLPVSIGYCYSLKAAQKRCDDYLESRGVLFVEDLEKYRNLL